MPAGAPDALRAWFYPGDNFGQEFVYAKSRATQLAEATKQTVLAMPAEVAERAAAVTKPGEPAVKELETAPVIGVTPEKQEVEIVQIPPPVILPEPMPASESLPKTASPFPLLALAGAISVGAAVGLRILRRRLS